MGPLRERDMHAFRVFPPEHKGRSSHAYLRLGFFVSIFAEVEN
jgi:hypothetical protein